MTDSVLFTIGAALCACWAAATLVLITANLDKRGFKTPWPLMRWYSIRNVTLYRTETLKVGGKPGPLYYSFIVSINAAWILALIALAVR